MVILARVLFDFEGAQSDDLSLKEGEIVEIIDKDESGWWIGKIDNRKGEFPFNYVQLLTEDEAKAYFQEHSNSSTDASSSSSTNNTNSNNNQIAMAGDSIDTMKVMGVEQGKNGMVHLIESSTKSGKVATSKRTIASFRMLDSQLRTLLPEFEGALPPKWADKTNLPPEIAKQRKDALEEYVEKLVSIEGANFLLVPWLFPGQGIQLSADAIQRAKEAQDKAKAQEASKPPESPPILARVLYSWEPQDRVELPMQEGEVIAVLNRETGARGWWEGQCVTGVRGLFPSNHVELMDSADAIAWMNGDASKAVSTTYASSHDEAAAASSSNSEKKKKPEKKEKAPRKPRVVPNFFLGSTSSFDELLEKGYCIETLSGTPYDKPTTPCPNSGDPVKLIFTQYLWDCQAMSLVDVLASSDPDEGPMEFIVDGEGEDADPSIIKGVMQCVKKMSKGTSVRLICTPGMAYGPVGAPPLIPPATHVVYDLKLEEFGEQKSRRASILMRLMKPPKPTVEARTRVTSLRGAKPIGNHAAGSSAVSTAASSSASSSSNEAQKEPTRRAGHILVDRTQPSNEIQTNRAKQSETKKKYEYQVLKQMCKDNVDFASLGMDRICLEDFLVDSGFEEAFQMDKMQFLLKPKWRQVAAKRQAGLI